MNGIFKFDGFVKVWWSKMLKYNGLFVVVKEGWYDMFKFDSCN